MTGDLDAICDAVRAEFGAEADGRAVSFDVGAVCDIQALAGHS